MKLALTSDQLTELWNRISYSSIIGVDTEGTYPVIPHTKGKGFSPHLGTLAGASFAFEEGPSVYLPIYHQGVQYHDTTVPARLISAAGKQGTMVAVHNLKHERHALKMYKQLTHVTCTMVMAWLLGKENLGLKDLTKRKDTFNDMAQGRDVIDIPPGEVVKYACEDAEGTLKLFKEFLPKIELWGLEDALVLEMEMVEVLANMEKRGMHVDTEGLRNANTLLQKELDIIEEEWNFSFPGVKISSPKQLRERFYDRGDWDRDVEKTPTGLYKVDHDALVHQTKFGTPLGQAAAELKLQWQELKKLASTYTVTLADMAEMYADKRIRPSFNSTVARTGRLSCSRPNLQNIPVRSQRGKELVKALFIPEPGNKLVSADYSQIELRVLAHFAGGKLAEAYIEGRDVHQQTADLVGVTRDIGKTGNFAVVYGAGRKRLAKAMGVSTEEAQTFIDNYNQAYPEINRVMRKMVDTAEERGYIKTLVGRRRYIHELRSEDRMIRFRGERIAKNTPVQGGAGDVVKRGMVAAHRAGLPIIGQVHDEVLCEVPEADAADAAVLLKRSLEEAFLLRVPLVADPIIGDNWLQCK